MMRGRLVGGVRRRNVDPKDQLTVKIDLPSGNVGFSSGSVKAVAPVKKKEVNLDAPAPATSKSQKSGQVLGTTKREKKEKFVGGF